MLDFTSALYLGLRHSHGALRPWAQLTTGRPAALEPAPEAVALAQDLAQFLGRERATLAPSTLHLFWDLFDVLEQLAQRCSPPAGSTSFYRIGELLATSASLRWSRLSPVKMPSPNA